MPVRDNGFCPVYYGTPYRSEQSNQWNYIRRLSNSVNIPWVLLGDLDITLSYEERKSTSRQSTSSDIVSLIRDSDLTYLGFSGNPFTWTSNKQGTCSNAFVLVNKLSNTRHILSIWSKSTFGNVQTKIHQLQADLSQLQSTDINGCNTDAVIALEKEINSLNDVLASSNAFVLVNNLFNTRHILSIWSKSTFGNVQTKIHQLQADLSQLQSTDINGCNTDAVIALEKEISSLNDVLSSSYRQKANDHFYKDMDKNSKYFHIKVKRRRARNIIDSLLAPDGSWCTDRESVENLLQANFQKFMTSFAPSNNYYFLEYIPKCITEEDN
ncbi:uncharacterized protein LOC113272678 [Papaver somniferum]|uniref:uncharacterized protein LOC113272678 n=1 Tax=Papaver somniferum TaxID=3469 RepID=UPI000E7055FC|nr:uncharacterized protein LOC113272678 [Papaver somniferum]